MNGDWLLRGRDGRLSVYQLSGDTVLCRAERGPGGPWSAPRRMGGDQKLHPVLAIGQGADRYAHLVSWRPTVKGESGLVHSTHFRPHLAALDWQPIGHPDKSGERTGTPAVAVDAQGRAHVFVRNKSGGVSMLGQKEKGGWGPWRDLKGSEVHDQLAAVTAASGTVEQAVLAHDRGQLPGLPQRFRQCGDDRMDQLVHVLGGPQGDDYGRTDGALVLFDVCLDLGPGQDGLHDGDRIGVGGIGAGCGQHVTVAGHHPDPRFGVGQQMVVAGHVPQEVSKTPCGITECLVRVRRWGGVGLRDRVGHVEHH
ncbi:hypothetical protein [Streptomyces eurythermus]